MEFEGVYKLSIMAFTDVLYQSRLCKWKRLVPLPVTTDRISGISNFRRVWMTIFRELLYVALMEFSSKFDRSATANKCFR